MAIVSSRTITYLVRDLARRNRRRSSRALFEMRTLAARRRVEGIALKEIHLGGLSATHAGCEHASLVLAFELVPGPGHATLTPGPLRLRHGVTLGKPDESPRVGSGGAVQVVSELVVLVVADVVRDLVPRIRVGRSERPRAVGDPGGNGPRFAEQPVVAARVGDGTVRADGGGVEGERVVLDQDVLGPPAAV